MRRTARSARVSRLCVSYDYDQGNEYGALLTDLFKTFDCLPPDLIVAKLHAYGFSTESLKLINSYLTERKQRVKMNDQFSS